jgi:hypothetical protein
MREAFLRASVAVMLVSVGAGCGDIVPTTSPPPLVVPSASYASPNVSSPAVHVSNATTLALTVTINGAFVAAVPPNDGADLLSDQLPGLPWTIAATTSSGRRLSTLDVDQDPGTAKSVAQLTDLSCGRLWLWVGSIHPEAPKPVPAGRPGDCIP